MPSSFGMLCLMDVACSDQNLTSRGFETVNMGVLLLSVKSLNWVTEELLIVSATWILRPKLILALSKSSFSSAWIWPRTIRLISCVVNIILNPLLVSKNWKSGFNQSPTRKNTEVMHIWKLAKHIRWY